MKITDVSVFHVAMPLKAPWKTAFSEETTIDTVLVRLRSGDAEGWGEAAPYAVPQFCPEWAAGAFILIRDVFGPRLVGREIGSGAELQHLFSPFKGNNFAKAAIDTAWWDLAARLDNRPLWQMIGGASPEVAVGADIPVQESTAALHDGVRAAVNGGFSRTKLKFRPDSGFEMVASVREAFPDMPLHIDCNSGFTLDDIDLFRRLDSLGLVMIEQPLGWQDLIDHATLQRELATPLCLDETLTSLEIVRQAVEIGATRWINIKHGRVGGLTNAIAIQRYAVEAGVPCWVGGMLESFVGQGVSLALATLPGMGYAADIFPVGRLYAEDLATPDITLSAPGTITAPDRPGHGFAPDPDRLRRCTVSAG
jgi:o-succinylbenzoate synthase